MKPRYLIPLLVCAGIPIILLADYYRTEPSASWKKIGKGMSAKEIQEIVGQPDITKFEGIEIWKKVGILRTTNLVVMFESKPDSNIARKAFIGGTWRFGKSYLSE
jgi:hypothetical protein